MKGIMSKPVTFGVIVGTRNIFNRDLAKRARAEIQQVLTSIGINYVILPDNSTPNGAVETVKDAIICANLLRTNQDIIDGILVLLPNFGDEIGVLETIIRSRLNVPILIQASNDENDKVDVRSRRDAFCGKISVCNNLYQNGIKFTDTTYHTCDITSSEFIEDLKRFAAICRTVKGLRNLRIGQIGTRPAAFRTVRYSEKLFQAAGITVEPVDMSDIFAVAERIKESDPDFKEKLQTFNKYGKINVTISDESIKKQVRFILAVERWMEKNELDASAIQCWDSILDNYGCAACLSMSLMGEQRIPSACEADIAGAVSMYALLLAGSSIPGFLDWNNNFGNEKDKCVCTHCSNFPKSFMGNEIEIGNLDVLSTVRDQKRCFGAIKGHVQEGPMTFFRVSTDDTKGRIKGYVGEGFFTNDSYGMDGGIAVCKVPKLRKLLATICTNGFEHHVAMARGHFASILYEATSKYLGWTIYNHTENDSDTAVLL
ncbi:MAG: hypothetical protein QXO96_06370 [Sulfolobales archaeon]